MTTSASVPRRNSTNPLLSLPNELLCQVSGMLSPNELFKAALVCRRWRHLLLDTPALWTRVRMSFGGNSAPQQSQWELALDCVLSRSARLPIDLSIYVDEDMNWQDDALSGVCDLLRTNMDCVKCFSLVAPSWLQADSDDSDVESGTIPAFLLQNAPILECFRLRVEAGCFSLAASEPLFAHVAPRLRALEFATYMPIMRKPYPLFRDVTTFTLEWPLDQGDELTVNVINNVLAQLPNLRRLTLLARAIERPETPFSASFDHLQVCGADWDVRRFFPNAREVVYSFHYAEPASGAQRLAEILRAENGVTSLDIRLVRACVDTTVAAVALKANGRLLATDLPLWNLDPFVETIISTVALDTLELLGVDGAVWVDFKQAEMPNLRELTVHIQRPDKDESFELLCDTSGPRWPAVSVLRVARLRIYETGNWEGEGPAPVALPAKLLTEFIAGRLDPTRLTKVVLRGWELLHSPDCRLPGHVTVVHEDEIVCEDWEPLQPWSDLVCTSEGLRL